MFRPIAIIASCCLALPAMADEFAPAMQQYLEEEVRQWSDNAVLVDAIRAQNARTAGLSQDEIDALDLAWRDEVGAGDRPTIRTVLENEAAAFLRERVAEAGGVITEVFVMDARGLNVAASDVTSDYWQGDEAKFIETFPNGAGGVHLGEVEFDESSQRFQGQISVTITDPSTGQALGAMTVGVDAEALM